MLTADKDDEGVDGVGDKEDEVGASARWVIKLEDEAVIVVFQRNQRRQRRWTWSSSSSTALASTTPAPK